MPDTSDYLSLHLDPMQFKESLSNTGLSEADLRNVLRFRRQFSDSGNRRKLFSAFDDYFSSLPSDVSCDTDPDPFVRGPIFLSRVAFRNWKVFADVDFNFPTLDETKPIILIGGKNGYGKTSFLEGILYCLFGRAAFSERAKLVEAEGHAPQSQRAAAYRKFLDRAFHRPSRALGESTMVVRTEWQTVQGPLCIERRWYLDDDGLIGSEDEVLMLWGGIDRDVVEVPNDIDASQFYQAEIERRLLSAGAASFMLFDAEQINWFSERAIDDQVRLVTERSFGLSEWGDAANDLRDYARDRGRRIEKEAGQYDHQRRRLEEFDQKINHLSMAIDSVEQERATSRNRREAIFVALAKLKEQTFDTMQSLLERRQLLAAERLRLSHEFASVASAALPVSFAGARLRSVVMASLEADRDSLRDEHSVFRNNRALKALTGRLRLQAPPSDASIEEVIAQLVSAWENLAQQNAKAEELRYPFLTQVLCENLFARLQRHGEDRERVQNLSDTLSAMADEERELSLKIEDVGIHTDAIVRHENELNLVGNELLTLEEKVDDLFAQRAQIVSDQSVAAMAFEEDFGSEATDQGQTIRYALELATRIEEAVEFLLPACFNKVAHALTRNYVALSHKHLVNEVRISVSGQVEVLDAAGDDLRAIEASAGEKQIFAMALLAAICEFVPNRLPSIIDTPLGRLDPDHRGRLLQFFSSRPIQTIMLSQPNEINGASLKLIDSKVAARFLLEYNGDSNGLGASQARQGYFDEVAA